MRGSNPPMAGSSRPSAAGYGGSNYTASTSSGLPAPRASGLRPPSQQSHSQLGSGSTGLPAPSRVTPLTPSHSGPGAHRVSASAGCNNSASASSAGAGAPSSTAARAAALARANARRQSLSGNNTSNNNSSMSSANVPYADDGYSNSIGTSSNAIGGGAAARVAGGAAPTGVRSGTGLRTGAGSGAGANRTTTAATAAASRITRPVSNTNSAIVSSASNASASGAAARPSAVSRVRASAINNNNSANSGNSASPWSFVPLPETDAPLSPPSNTNSRYNSASNARAHAGAVSRPNAAAAALPARSSLRGFAGNNSGGSSSGGGGAAGAGAVRARLLAGRSSGVLSLANCRLTELPPVLLDYYNTDPHGKEAGAADGDARWWEFVDLVTLDLSSNALTSLPASLASSLGGALTSLALDNNALSSVGLPGALLRGLPLLRVLSVRNNRLERLPAAVGALAALTHLHCDGHALAALPGLQVLTASNNRLAALFTEQDLDDDDDGDGGGNNGNQQQQEQQQGALLFGGNSSRLAQARSKQATVGNGSNNNNNNNGSFACMQSLLLLDFSHNNLSSAALAPLLQSLPQPAPSLTTGSSVSGFAPLERLDLSHNDLVSPFPSLAPLLGLRTLDLSFNGLAALPVLPTLPVSSFAAAATGNTASLSSSSSGGGGGSGGGDAGRFEHRLESLSAAHNALTDASTLLSCQSLSTLSLSENRLPAVPPAVLGLRRLTALSLASNDISDLPPALGALPALSRIALEGNPLRAVPPHIRAGGATKLKLWLCSRLEDAAGNDNDGDGGGDGGYGSATVNAGTTTAGTGVVVAALRAAAGGGGASGGGGSGSGAGGGRRLDLSSLGLTRVPAEVSDQALLTPLGLWEGVFEVALDNNNLGSANKAGGSGGSGSANGSKAPRFAGSRSATVTAVSPEDLDADSACLDALSAPSALSPAVAALTVTRNGLRCVPRGIIPQSDDSPSSAQVPRNPAVFAALRSLSLAGNPLGHCARAPAPPRGYNAQVRQVSNFTESV